MGCGQSKVPRGEGASAAVAHCRDRSELLAAAIASRYALADANRAYAGSLSATGAALHDFLRAVLDATPPPPGPSAGDAPREGDDDDAAPHAATASPDASEDDDDDDDGGHICFPSPSDEASDDDGGGDTMSTSDDEAEPPLPRPDALQPVAPAPRPPRAPPQPLQLVPQYDPGYPPQFGSLYPPPYSYGPVPGPAFGYGGGYGADVMGGYGQSSYTYNISYTQRQPPPPSSTSFEQPPQTTDATVSYYTYQYHGEAVPSSHYGGSYYYPYPYPQGGGLPPVPAASSGHLAAPLPSPSPPRVPSWGFLDPFEALESYYQEHPVPPAARAASSRSLGDVGEEDEGIPDLEDEESGVVVRDAHAGDECTRVNAKFEEVHRKSESSDGSGSSEEETEGHVEFRSSTMDGVEESVVVEVEEQLNDDSGVADEPPAVPEIKTYTSDVQVAQEIKLQFDTASKSAGDVSKMLEVDKVPYYKKKNSGLKVPSMVICGQPSKAKAIMQYEEEKAMESGNLSSSLQKLYIWENKLLKEVKAMEKIRGLYDQKRKEQKRLYYSGAESHKLEAMEICVKKLSTKLTIAIQIVNSISKNINKLRDEELWPQTHEIIKGFMQMWHTMSECHEMQCHVLSHAKNIDSTMAAARINEDHTDLIKYLEVQLLGMTANFTGWFDAQKSYAILLNEWLKKGIEYEPEVTDDGVPPFSPGRLGAPPIFTVYNNWATSMARISEAEVVGAVQALASNVLGLWEKKIAGVSSSAQAAEAGLQSCMARVFEAMESFAAACENTYKDICLRAEEENGRAPVADIAGTRQLG
ncbi:uncharacterized protein [Setaria viridis]|uniref:uncharacterized protein n=1 Tax=Setaria viridis TaxID=4556 RepID=UPI001493B055|nr:protein ROLLING AND ERECT LEAF 2-like [Setaria viridis]